MILLNTWICKRNDQYCLLYPLGSCLRGLIREDETAEKLVTSMKTRKRMELEIAMVWAQVLWWSRLDSPLGRDSVVVDHSTAWPVRVHWMKLSRTYLPATKAWLPASMIKAHMLVLIYFGSFVIERHDICTELKKLQEKRRTTSFIFYLSYVCILSVSFKTKVFNCIKVNSASMKNNYHQPAICMSRRRGR